MDKRIAKLKALAEENGYSFHESKNLCGDTEIILTKNNSYVLYTLKELETLMYDYLRIS